MYAPAPFRRITDVPIKLGNVPDLVARVLHTMVAVVSLTSDNYELSVVRYHGINSSPANFLQTCSRDGSRSENYDRPKRSNPASNCDRLRSSPRKCYESSTIRIIGGYSIGGWPKQMGVVELTCAKNTHGV